MRRRYFSGVHKRVDVSIRDIKKRAHMEITLNWQHLSLPCSLTTASEAMATDGRLSFIGLFARVGVQAAGGMCGF